MSRPNKIIDREIKPLEYYQKDGVVLSRGSLRSEASTALDDSFSSFKLLDIKELLGGSKRSLKLDEEFEKHQDQHQNSTNSLRFPSFFSSSGSNLNAKMGLGGSSHHSSRGSKSSRASKLFNMNRLFQSESILGVELLEDDSGDNRDKAGKSHPNVTSEKKPKEEDIVKGSNHSKNGMIFNRIFKSESSLKVEKDVEDKPEEQGQDDDKAEEQSSSENLSSEDKEDALEVAEQNETIKKLQRKQRSSRSPPRRTKSTSEDKPTRRKRPSPRRTKSSVSDGEKGPALRRSHTHTGVKVSPRRRTKSSAAADDEKLSKRPAPLRRTNSSVEGRTPRSSRIIKSRASDHKNDRHRPALRRTNSSVEARAKLRTGSSRSPLRRANSTIEDGRPIRSTKTSSANTLLGASLGDLNHYDGASKSTGRVRGGRGASSSPHRSKPEIAKKVRKISSTDDTADLLKSSNSSLKNHRKARSPPRSSSQSLTRSPPRRTKSSSGDHHSPPRRTKSSSGDHSPPRRTRSFDAPHPYHKTTRSPKRQSPRQSHLTVEGSPARKKEYEDVLSIWGMEGPSEA